MELDSQLFKRSLAQAVVDWPLSISDDELEACWVHFRAVIECNRQFNLTRITEPRQAAVKHYADSLALIAWANASGLELSTILDVGTGAGFPAIPIAVMKPNVKVVAIESTAKKASFVDRTAKLMALKNLQVEHAHSSHWKSTARFQIVTGRAVSNVAACIRSFGAYVEQGGYSVLFKAADMKADEISEGQKAARRAGFTMCKPFLYELPPTESQPSGPTFSPEPRALACADSRSVIPNESDKQQASVKRQLVIFQR